MLDVHTWQSVEAPKEKTAVTFSFHIISSGYTEEAFIVRHNGKLYAYINRCPHAGTTLDWNPGHFFSDNGKALVCHTHLAHFDPENGACLSGFCEPGLVSLPIRNETEKSVVVPAEIAYLPL